MAGTFWQRVRASFEDGMRQQITRTGLLFSLTIVLIGLAAFASANNLLFLLLAALLGTLLISGFISRLGLAGLELDLELPEHIAAKRKVTGQLVLTNRKRWVPSFSIHLSGAPQSGMASELYLPIIPAKATLREPLQLFFGHRGLYRDNTFFFTSRFPFGFTQRRAQVRLTRDVMVYPSIDPQPGFEELLAGVAGEIESAQRGRGSDFYRIRPYEALESSRHVDWKATAHTGGLQVREFTRDQDQTVTVFLDLDIPESRQQWFETAIECCAFLAWQLSRQPVRLRFVTQRFDCTIPGEANVYIILRYLACAAPARGLDLPKPNEDSTFQIAITARPSHVLEEGWNRARILGVNDFTAALTDHRSEADQHTAG